MNFIKGKRLLLILVAAMPLLVMAQDGKSQQYEINADVPAMKIYSDHLKLGGTNTKGEKIGVHA